MSTIPQNLLLNKARDCMVRPGDYKAVDVLPEDEFYAKQCRFWNEGYPNWWLLSNVKRLSKPIQSCVAAMSGYGRWMSNFEKG